MVSKYQYCLAHTLFRAFSDTAEAASHQTEAGELSHNDWHDYSVQESNTESTEEQVLMAVFYLIVFENNGYTVEQPVGDSSSIPLLRGTYMYCYASRRSHTRDTVKLTVCVSVCLSVCVFEL